MAEHQRLRAIVKGAVQGVGYRYFVIDLAKKLNLTGFTRNLPDGSVEVVAEGEIEALRTLLARLYDGPRTAVVRDVDALWSDNNGEFSFFGVKH